MPTCCWSGSATVGAIERSTRRGEGGIDAEQAAGLGVEGDACAGRSENAKRFAVGQYERCAWVAGVGPFGEPVEAQRGVEAVEIGQTGKQAVRVLAHVKAQRAMEKFRDGGRERRMADGATAARRDLAE